MAMTLFPLLTNSVIRSFAWINILGKNGVVNTLLLKTGLIEQPLNLLYTEFAIIIGSVYLFLPTMIMTLVGVMENIEGEMLEAAARRQSNDGFSENCFTFINSRHHCRKYISVYRNFNGLYDATAVRW